MAWEWIPVTRMEVELPTFSFNKASLTGLVDRMTGAVGRESLESAIVTDWGWC